MDESVSSTRVTIGGAALETVTVTGSEVNRIPSASRATAIKVWNPLLVVVVSQKTEYGALVSSVPRLTPSSWNWTPATRRPTALTLARTVIVPATVVSEVGDVMVTTRRPGRGGSCAKAWSGEIQAQPKIATSAAAQTRLTRGTRVPFILLSFTRGNTEEGTERWIPITLGEIPKSPEGNSHSRD